MGCFLRRFELPALAWFLSLLLPLSAAAAPAPWYKWQSVTGAIVCAQTSPGDGWFRLGRTYVDPRCLRQDKAADAPRDQNRPK